MSRTIGSPSCIIHRPLLYIPRSFAPSLTTSLLHLHLSISPSCPPLFCPFSFSHLPLSLLIVQIVAQGPLLSSLRSFSTALFGIRALSQHLWLPSFKAPCPLPSLTYSSGQTDSWLPTRGGAFDLRGLQESTAALMNLARNVYRHLFLCPSMAAMNRHVCTLKHEKRLVLCFSSALCKPTTKCGGKVCEYLLMSCRFFQTNDLLHEVVPFELTM